MYSAIKNSMAFIMGIAYAYFVDTADDHFTASNFYSLVGFSHLYFTTIYVRQKV